MTFQQHTYTGVPASVRLHPFPANDDCIRALLGWLAANNPNNPFTAQRRRDCGRGGGCVHALNNHDAKTFEEL